MQAAQAPGQAGPWHLEPTVAGEWRAAFAGGAPASRVFIVDSGEHAARRDTDGKWAPRKSLWYEMKASWEAHVVNSRTEECKPSRWNWLSRHF